MIRAVIAAVVAAGTFIVVVPLVVFSGAATATGSSVRISAVGCGPATCLVGTTSGEVARVGSAALDAPSQVLSGPVTALACTMARCFATGDGLAQAQNPPRRWSRASSPAPPGVALTAVGCGPTVCVSAWSSSRSHPGGAAVTDAAHTVSWQSVALFGMDTTLAATCTQSTCVVAGTDGGRGAVAVVAGGRLRSVGGLGAGTVADDVGCGPQGACLVTGIGDHATTLSLLDTTTGRLAAVPAPGTQVLQAACGTAGDPPRSGSSSSTTTTTQPASGVVCPVVGIGASSPRLSALTLRINGDTPGAMRRARVAPAGEGALDELACDEGSPLCVCVADGPGGQEVFRSDDAGVTWHPISAAALQTTRTGAPPTWVALAVAAAQSTGCATPLGFPPLWAILLGIADVESDFGQSSAPGVASGSNPDGAQGPMQFLPATFARYDEPVPPGGAAPPSPYDAIDAVYAAARLLCANGVARDPQAAVFSYDHSASYVDEVLADARAFAASRGIAPGETPTQAAALGVAESLIGTPYVFGGASPAGFDCSGLVWYSFLAAGVTLPRGAAAQFAIGPPVAVSGLVPGDLVFFSDASGIAHVGIYAGAGEMVDAPHEGADVRFDAFTPVIGAAWGDEVFAGATSPGGATS